jgi:hypothetical protein
MTKLEDLKDKERQAWARFRNAQLLMDQVYIGIASGHADRAGVADIIEATGNNVDRTFILWQGARIALQAELMIADVKATRAA